MEVHSEVLARRRLSTRWHRYLRSSPRAWWARVVRPSMTALLGGGVVLAAMAMHLWPSVVPFSGFIPFAVLAGLQLTPRNLALVDVVLLGSAAWAAVERGRPGDFVYIGAYVVLAGVMVIMFCHGHVARAPRRPGHPRRDACSSTCATGCAPRGSCPTCPPGGAPSCRCCRPTATPSPVTSS